jgi:hypothetical protein
MGSPEREFVLEALAPKRGLFAGKVKKVHAPDCARALPEHKPCLHAIALRISGVVG